MMTTPKRAFTLIELAMVLVIVAALALLMAPLMKQRWNAAGESASVNNVRQILAATDTYRNERAVRGVPMRGPGYSNGQITGGWDTWNFAGKNCSTFWQSGPFDESAYARFLNPYLSPTLAPVPPGYVNTGSGTTWTFNDGTPTLQQRQTFKMEVCRSPGDVSTRQQNWPNATPGISCYDDVGTSYHVNMKWWALSGGPAGFTARYNAGTTAINAIRATTWYRPWSRFVLYHDQMADIIAQFPGNVNGEFGGRNMSVCGFIDGRAAYIKLKSDAVVGPGYDFRITWP